MKTGRISSVERVRVAHLPPSVRVAWFLGALAFFMTFGIPLAGPLVFAAFVAAVSSFAARMSG